MDPALQQVEAGLLDDLEREVRYFLALHEDAGYEVRRPQAEKVRRTLDRLREARTASVPY